jgi:hypothetical protein
MIDRRSTLLIDRLRAIAARKERFSYDVRGDSHVYTGVVAPYRLSDAKGEVNELAPVLEHALAHDAIVSGVKDPASGKTVFTSGRLFTDIANAVRFARTEQQPSVYNWNRGEEVFVDPPAASLPSTTGSVEALN